MQRKRACSPPGSTRPGHQGWGDPWVCPLGPGRQWTSTPHNIVCIEGTRLKVDIWSLEDRNDRVAMIVVRPVGPLDHLGSRLNKNVWIGHAVPDKGHTHTAVLSRFHYNVDNGIPGSQPVVNPQPINPLSQSYVKNHHEFMFIHGA